MLLYGRIDRRLQARKTQNGGSTSDEAQKWDSTCNFEKRLTRLPKLVWSEHLTFFSIAIPKVSKCLAFFSIAIPKFKFAALRPHRPPSAGARDLQYGDGQECKIFNPNLLNGSYLRSAVQASLSIAMEKNLRFLLRTSVGNASRAARTSPPASC